MVTRSFWGAAALTLICAVAGSELAQVPYLNLVGALVIALLLGMACQLAPPRHQCESRRYWFYQQ